MTLAECALDELPILCVASLFHTCAMCHQTHAPGACFEVSAQRTKADQLVEKVQQEDVGAKEANAFARLQRYIASNGFSLGEGWRARVKPRVTKRPNGNVCRSTHNDYFDAAGKRFATFEKVLDHLKQQQHGSTTSQASDPQAPAVLTSGASTPASASPASSSGGPGAPLLKRPQWDLACCAASKAPRLA